MACRLLVSLDVTHTVIGLRRSIGCDYLNAAVRSGLVREGDIDARLVDKEFRTAWKASRDRWPAFGANHSISSREWWRAVVLETYQRAGINVAGAPHQFERTFRDLFEGYADNASAYWFVHDDAIALLAFLRDQPAVGVVFLSNFDERLHTILDKLKLREGVNAVVLSRSVGRDKPDSAMFEAAMTAVNVSDRHSVVHIGNDPVADVHGARAVGCHGWLLDRTSHADHRAANAVEGPVLSSLMEVPQLLRERFPNAFSSQGVRASKI